MVILLTLVILYLYLLFRYKCKILIIHILINIQFRSFFRQNLIGSTDPLIASPDSIRGMISNQWKELGLSGPCSTGDNGIHASASPYEGLVEKMNWLGRPISEESFGIGLIRNGVAEDTIKVMK